MLALLCKEASSIWGNAAGISNWGCPSLHPHSLSLHPAQTSHQKVGTQGPGRGKACLEAQKLRAADLKIRWELERQLHDLQSG